MRARKVIGAARRDECTFDWRVIETFNAGMVRQINIVKDQRCS